MRSASVVLSHRGSLGENGPLPAAQRSSTFRPRLSFLERVDEAHESDSCAAQRPLRSPTPTSPGHFSSDEDIENRQRQRTRATTAKAAEQRESLARRGSVRSHSRQPLESLPRSGATTLNEKKQKKLVALFYWRRRALETYFSAWKWVVFDRKSRQQQRELQLLRPYAPAPVRPVSSMDNSYPRHQSALLRNTLQRQRSDSVVSSGRQSSHRDRMASLRDEYRQLKASAVQQGEADGPTSETQPLEDDAAAKRKAYKERLCVFYQNFEAWREFVSQSQVEYAQHSECAWGHYRKHQLQKCFRRWASTFLEVRRSQTRLWLRACDIGDRCARRRRFRSWKLWHLRQQSEKHRADEITRLRMMSSVTRWRLWTDRTIHLQQAGMKRRQVMLRRYFSRFNSYRLHRLGQCALQRRATALNQSHSMRRTWYQWYRVVFADEDVARIQALTKQISQQSAVTKWKRFVARRREIHLLAEQADCCLYEGLLRRFWSRWMSFLSLRAKNQEVYDRAIHHWACHRKRQAIQTLLTHRCASKFERERMQGAKDFHVLRLIRTAMFAWRSHVCVVQRSRAFRCIRVKRRMVLCFVAWRQHTKRSRRLYALQVAVFAQSRARILQYSLHVWEYRYKLATAYRLVDSRYAARLVETCMRAWRDIVLRRRSWNGIVNQLCAKRSLELQGLVFSAIQRYSVGARCRRRLVRLFQKKHLRNMLRQSVQALCSHAKCERFVRAVESRRLQSTWHSWVMYKSDQQRRTEANALAAHFFSSRRYALAIDLWIQNSRRSCYARQRNARAIGHLITRIMRRTMHAWYLASRARARKREPIEMCTAKRQRSQLQRYLKQWETTAQIMRRQRHDFYRVWRRAMFRRRELVFFAWRGYISHKRAHLQFLESTRRKRLYRLGRKVLRTWRTVAYRLKRLRAATQAVSARLRRHLLEHVICVWRDVAVNWHCKRMNTIKAASFHREFLLLWIFYDWQHASTERQIVREKQRRATEAITKILFERSLNTWKTQLARRHQDKAIMNRATAFNQKRRRTIGVDAWCAFVSRRQERASKSKRASSFAVNSLNRRVFRRWIQFTSGTRHFKSKLRVIFQTGDNDVLRRAFCCWRRYKRKQTLDQRAESWREQSVLRMVWRHWWRQVMFASKMRKNVLITSRLLQSSATRLRFTQWKEYIARRRLRAQELERAEAHHTVHCYRTAIRRLRVAVRHARAIELSGAFHSRHSQRRQFMRWYRGVIAQKNRRQQKAFVEKRAAVARVCRAFSGWKCVVSTRLGLFHARAEQYSNALILKHTWTAWKRMIWYRHLQDHLRAKHVHNLILASFRQWTQYCGEQRQIRRHVEAAVAHLDRVTMQKIWERWSDFVGKRREYHRLKKVALSFYVTNIVQQRYFWAWWGYVLYRHEKQTKRFKADEFFLKTSLRRTLEHWTAYVEHRNNRMKAKDVEDDAIQRCLASRAVRKWHNRTFAMRSQLQAHSRASSFFVQRAESKAVHLLRSYAISTKSNRDVLAKAIAHRKRKLLQLFFSRWKRFLVWRQHHHHLLRLFRSNQLSDYFALWRKYLAYSKRKRSLHLTATQGYRTLVQRNVFGYWRMRCRQWHNKRRAIRWCNERLGRLVLNAWSHRVRVLGKMRQMFRFQDSFRLESHFNAWKRYWWRKKQQVVRVKDAMVWYNKQRLIKCFSLWTRWMDLKRAEKATVQMAVRFRIRFFSRKYLKAWWSVALWKKRKALLDAEAIRTFQLKISRKAFKQLAANAKVNKSIQNVTLEASEALTSLKVQRSVAKWRQYLQRRRNLRALRSCAIKHEHCGAIRRTWVQLRQWYGVRRVKGDLLQRAQRHCDHVITRRVFTAWGLYEKTQRRLQTGLKRFKDRYFRGVVDDSFFRWTHFMTLKRRLRALKEKVDRSRMRRALGAWKTIAEDARKRSAAVATMKIRRSRQLLNQCMVHWESVTTEKWIYARLVRAAQQQRELRIKGLALQRWTSLLPMRHARQKWRENARTRNRQLLVDILQSWRWLATQDASDSESDHCPVEEFKTWPV